jgi:hypothetical protein
LGEPLKRNVPRLSSRTHFIGSAGLMTMNVSFSDFGPDIPRMEMYERGVDYLSHEFDLGFEDIFYLVSCLKNNRSHVDVFAPSATVQFYIFNRELNVQIDGLFSGFWHASNVDLATAREILRVASKGCTDFGVQIPGTNRDWDVY